LQIICDEIDEIHLLVQLLLYDDEEEGEHIDHHDLLEVLDDEVDRHDQHDELVLVDKDIYDDIVVEATGIRDHDDDEHDELDEMLLQVQ